MSRISFDDIKNTANNETTIFVTTRSMTKKKIELRNEEEKNREEEKIGENSKVEEELTSNFDKNIPRIKTTKIMMNKNKQDVDEIEISVYERHRIIFKIHLVNEILTLKAILSKMDEYAQKLNKNELQWPMRDKIFDLCTINEMKIACRKHLKYTKILLIPTPEEINDEKMKANILNKFHYDPIFGGHTGQKKLYAKIRERYYWKNITKDIAKLVRNCEICQKSKVLSKTKQPMVLTTTPQKAFDLVLIDTIGKLPKTINGNEYAVTIICELTKYLIIIPTKTKTAKDIAKAIFEKFILTFGPMKELRTDMGTEYNNELIEEICNLLKIDHKISTAYHHESLGTIERSHRTLNQFIRSYIDKNIENWDTYSKYFEYCYNTTKHESNNNKFSPFELVFGKQSILAYDTLNGQIDNYAKEIKYRLQTARKMTKEIIEENKIKSKKYYDSKLNPIEVEIGESVYINTEPYKNMNC